MEREYKRNIKQRKDINPISLKHIYISIMAYIMDEEKWFQDLPRSSVAEPLSDATIDESSPEAVQEWFQNLHLHSKPKLTKLHFFVHDNVTATNPTAVLVAPADAPSIASTQFGSTYAMDDPITVSSDPSSKTIGRAQGTFTFVSQTDPVLSMSVKLVFTEGKYKDSTLTIMGNNPISRKYREMPILGGTGAFRLARGIATVNTVTVDIAKLNDILEYNVILQHY